MAGTIFIEDKKKNIALRAVINIILLMLVYWFLDLSKVTIGVTHNFF